MQNIKETSDTLRGLKVNARKHWDGESWILEDAKTRKPLLIGTRSQILDEYDHNHHISLSSLLFINTFVSP